MRKQCDRKMSDDTSEMAAGDDEIRKKSNGAVLPRYCLRSSSLFYGWMATILTRALDKSVRSNTGKQG